MAKKSKSRSARWADAVGEARQLYDHIHGTADDLASALMELKSVQDEYADWKDNLPENLQSSALGEKLEVVVDLDIEAAANDPLDNWGDVESLLDEAEGIELPQGFGRD
jgi:hypothetical protein